MYVSTRIQATIMALHNITKITAIRTDQCSDPNLVLLDYPALKETRTITVHYNQALSLCCRTGNLTALEVLVERFPNMDVATNHNEALRWACEYGQTDVIEYLHTHYQEVIDITALDHYALRLSCKNGHTSTVKFLLDHWDSVDVRAKQCYAFWQACAKAHYDTAKLLLERYGSVISSCDSVFSDGRTLTSICHNRWVNMVETLIPGLITALNHNPIGTLDGAVKALSSNCWPGVVRRLICACDQTLHHYLVNAALEHSYVGSNDQVSVMIINEFTTDISTETVNKIYGLKQNHEDRDGHQGRHTVLDLLASKFRDAITLDTYRLALEQAANHACESALDMFVTDLRDKITNETCDWVLEQTLIAKSNMYDTSSLSLIVRKFGDRLSVPVCNEAFRAGCMRLNPKLIVACLDCVRDKIDLSIMIPAMRRWYLRHDCVTAISIIRACGGDIAPEDIGLMLSTRWDSIDLVQALVEYYPRVNANILNSVLTEVDSASRVNLFRKTDYDAVKMLVSAFKDRLNCTSVKILLMMRSRVLFYLLTAIEVKGLIDQYRHEEGMDKAIKMLDPNHPSTEHVLFG